MKRDAYESPFNLHNAPYNLALATAASSSAASVWSDSSSQHSDDSNSSAASDSDSCDSYCFSQPVPSSSQSSVSSVESACEPIAKLLNHQHKQCLQQTQSELPARQNPRRTRRVDSFRAPPTLVRQTERKHNFVDNLVGKDYD